MTDKNKEPANDNSPLRPWDGEWDCALSKHEKWADMKMVMSYNLTDDITIIVYRVLFRTTVVTKVACLSRADDTVYRVIWDNFAQSSEIVPIANN